MSNISQPGERVWHKHYESGVSTNFQPEVTTWTEMMSRAFDAYADTVLIEYYGKS